jgi:class 3 adenylate cyclase/tetratricopeptide (TPR) repeat protein
VVSVLFADLVGFTSLSEDLDAEDVAALQDQYFARVRQTIDRYGGRVEKFIGDAAMAVFGVPRARDDDAERAVRAGLALVSTVESLAAQIGLGESSLRLRVGVNTGEVAYGTTDDDEWRVSGDAVNTAARLQTAAEPGTVLIGDGTALAVAESIALDAPVELALKGKNQTVPAWRAVTPLPARSREQAMGALRAPLLGREAEMRVIGAALARTQAGGSEALFVIAPPGVGKSRLTSEIAQRAQSERGQSITVLRVRLGPDSGSPATMVRQLFLAGLGTDVPDTDRARTIVQLLGEKVPGARGAELGAEVARLLAESDAAAEPVLAAGLGDEREVRFRQWTESLEALAAGRPHLWLIEDLHWADGDVLAFIEQVADRPAAGGRFLLATARPTLLEQLRERPDLPVGTILELAPLAAPNAGELVNALVGEALPRELVEAVIARSDGNPLFIEELLRSWISLGTLVARDDGTWQLTRAVGALALPQTVQQIYGAQLDDLPAGTRALVRRASVAGRNVPRHSLGTFEVPDTDGALAIARRRALLDDAPADPVAGPLLGYRHALLRDAGYTSLARAERARLHARLAGWYRARAGTRVDDVAEQIAGHYGAAVDHASRLSPELDDGLDLEAARRLAIEWYERAARRALVGAEHESARSLLRQALRHAGGAGSLVRARLLLSLGEATAYTADMAQGAGLLSEAVDLYGAALDTTAAAADAAETRTGYAAAVAALARVWIQQVRFNDAGRLAGEALNRLPDDDDPAIAPLLGIRSWVTATLAPDRSAVIDADRALGIALHAGDRRLELEVRDWRASALGELGDFSIDEWLTIERLAVELGDWRRAVKAMRFQAAVLVDDEHERVWPITDRALEIAHRRGQEEDVCWIEYTRAEAAFASGDWDEAHASGMRAVELGERNSYDRAVVRTLHVLLPIATARGQREIVERSFLWHKARKHLFPDSPYARIMEAAIELHCSRAGLQPLQVPEVEPRLASFEGEPGGPSWLAALEVVLESWLVAGRLEAVAGAVSRMEQGVSGAPSTSRLGRGTTAFCRARLLAAQSAPPEDVQRPLREALQHFRASRAPWWMSKALRLLRDGGSATGDEAAELEHIVSQLGLVER